MKSTGERPDESREAEGLRQLNRAIAAGEAVASSLGSTYWHSLDRRIANLPPAEKDAEYKRWNEKSEEVVRIAREAGTSALAALELVPSVCERRLTADEVDVPILVEGEDATGPLSNPHGQDLSPGHALRWLRAEQAAGRSPNADFWRSRCTLNGTA